MLFPGALLATSTATTFTTPQASRRNEAPPIASPTAVTCGSRPAPNTAALISSIPRPRSRPLPTALQTQSASAKPWGGWPRPINAISSLRGWVPCPCRPLGAFRLTVAPLCHRQPVAHRLAGPPIPANILEWFSSPCAMAPFATSPRALRGTGRL